MQKLILIFFTLIYCVNSNAEELSNKIAETASHYISNLIPGEGTTEVSIQLRENYKPDFSILGVIELDRTDSENTFVQFSLFNTERLNK